MHAFIPYMPRQGSRHAEHVAGLLANQDSFVTTFLSSRAFVPQQSTRPWHKAHFASHYTLTRLFHAVVVFSLFTTFLLLPPIPVVAAIALAGNTKYTPSSALFASYYHDVATATLYIHGGYIPDISNQSFTLDLSKPWTVDDVPWSPLPYSPSAFDSAAMALSPNGTKLMFFGAEQSYDPLLGIFDLSSKQWWYRNSSITNLKQRVTGLKPIADPETGIFYIRGGYQSDKVDQLNIYNPLDATTQGSLEVKPLPKLIAPAQWYSSTWSTKRQSVLTFGGKMGALTADYVPPLLYEYVPRLDQWAVVNTAGQSPTPREDACMVTTSDGNKLIIFGGMRYTDDDVLILGDIYILDLNTLVWKQGATSNDPRVAMVCASQDDAFISMMGSKDYLFYYPYGLAPSIYNLTTDTWTTGYKMAPLPPKKPDNEQSKTPLGLIIGLTLGATALGAIVVGMCLYKREKSKAQHGWRKYYAERSNRRAGGDHSPGCLEEGREGEGPNGGVRGRGLEAVAKEGGVTTSGGPVKGVTPITARGAHGLLSKKSAEKYLGGVDDAQILGNYIISSRRGARRSLESDDKESIYSTTESSSIANAAFAGDGDDSNGEVVTITKPRKAKRSSRSGRRIREAVSDQKIELSPTPTNTSGKIEEPSIDDEYTYQNGEYEYAPPRRRKQSSYHHSRHPREQERKREREREREQSRSRTRRRAPPNGGGGGDGDGQRNESKPSARKRVQSKSSGGHLRVKTKPAPGAEVDKSKFPYNPEYRAFDDRLVRDLPLSKDASLRDAHGDAATVVVSPPAAAHGSSLTTTCPHINPAPPVAAESDEMAPLKG